MQHEPHAVVPLSGAITAPESRALLRQRFVQQLGSGQRPLIEGFLEQASATDRGELVLELAQIEFDDRCRRGQSTTFQYWALGQSRSHHFMTHEDVSGARQRLPKVAPVQLVESDWAPAARRCGEIGRGDCASRRLCPWS